MLPRVDGLPTVVGGVRAALAVPWSCADAARLGNRLKGTAMNFNDRLADLRRKKGLSQEQLGYELGVSRQTVSKWGTEGYKRFRTSDNRKQHYRR